MMYDSYALVYDSSGQLQFSLLTAYYLENVLQRHPVAGRRALDLACGTGTLALLLAERGWQVSGLDRSTAMLAQARAKLTDRRPEHCATFLEGDMRCLERLFAPAMADLITCTYDSLNYLLTEADLAACFAGVAHTLAPGGLFYGDMNTRHFLAHDWEPYEIREQPGYIQVSRSQFDPQQSISVLHLSGFVGSDDQGYARFDEIHHERAYPPERISALWRQVGLDVEAIYDCFTLQPPYATSQRLAWVVRKPAGDENTGL